MKQARFNTHLALLLSIKQSFFSPVLWKKMFIIQKYLSEICFKKLTIFFFKKIFQLKSISNHYLHSINVTKCFFFPLLIFLQLFFFFTLVYANYGPKHNSVGWQKHQGREEKLGWIWGHEDPELCVWWVTSTQGQLNVLVWSVTSTQGQQNVLVLPTWK